MKVLFKIVLLSLLGLAISVSDKDAIGSAISEIVRKQFVNTLSNLRIVKYSGESTEIDGIANEIVKRSENESISFEIIDLKQKQLKKFDLNQSTSRLFYDLGSFLDFHNSMLFKATSVDHQHPRVLRNRKQNEIRVEVSVTS